MRVTRLSGTRGKRLQRNAGALLSLNKASNSVKQSVIASAKKDLILTLVDCAKIIINGEAEITPNQYTLLKRRSSELRELIKSSTPLHKKKLILQNGGFLGLLLKPLLGSVLPALLGGINPARR